MHHNSKVAVIIPAAGKGMRFGADKPKQYSVLGEQTILERSVNIFLNIPEVLRVIIAVDQDDKFIHSQSFIAHPKITIVNGGSSRSTSVFNAVKILEARDIPAVAIHDASRPWLQPNHFLDLLCQFHAHNEWDGVYPAIEIIDSIREKRNDELVPVNRENFMQIQTPQIFNTNALQIALKKVIDSGMNLTDETQAMENAGYRVKAMQGDRSNLKVTYSHDLNAAKNIDYRIGRGIDFHKLLPGSGITLGGISIVCDLAIVAHSDGDIVLHALADALLGAGGLNDIGFYFPDTDSQNKGLSSLIIIKKAMGLLAQKNLQPSNVDLVIICEQPKISPHVNAMKARLASLLTMETGDISIKATTTEGMGIIGQGNGIAVYAITSLKKLI